MTQINWPEYAKKKQSGTLVWADITDIAKNITENDLGQLYFMGFLQHVAESAPSVAELDETYDILLPFVASHKRGKMISKMAHGNLRNAAMRNPAANDIFVQAMKRFVQINPELDVASKPKIEKEGDRITQMTWTMVPGDRDDK